MNVEYLNLLKPSQEGDQNRRAKQVLWGEGVLVPIGRGEEVGKDVEG
jgi:hypothetical protein